MLTDNSCIIAKTEQELAEIRALLASPEANGLDDDDRAILTDYFQDLDRRFEELTADWR